MKRLAIITTHPIQYYAPIFRMLTENRNIRVRVFYTWSQSEQGAKFDPGFGKVIEWDIPILEGYDYLFVKNIAKHPGSHHFNGIDNPDLIDQLYKWNPTAILVFGWNFKSHLKVMRHFKNRIPVIFRGDSTLLDEARGFRRIARRLFLTWVYRHVDIALFVGYYNRQYFLVHGLKDNQLVFAPHAIDNNRFSTDRQNEVKQFRDSLGLKPSDFLILFAGKFEKKKNPQILIRAVSAIKSSDVHLLLVGNGNMESDLKEKAEMSPVSSNIHFLPFQNQNTIPVVYQSCDVFCLPSQGPGETWGLCINEAMACGKPVIVSNKAGCSGDLVQNGINGYIFDSSDPEDLRSKIELLYHDRNLRIRMGENSCEIIRSWDIPIAVKNIEDIVNNI